MPFPPPSHSTQASSPSSSTSWSWADAVKSPVADTSIRLPTPLSPSKSQPQTPSSSSRAPPPTQQVSTDNYPASLSESSLSTTTSSSATSPSNSLSPTKSKKKKHVPEPIDIDSDLIALEEAQQLATMPVEHVEWAKRVIKLAERYTNRVVKVGPNSLRLTRVDDELYTRFRAEMPEFDICNVGQDQLTGPEYQNKWQILHAEFAAQLPEVYGRVLLRIHAAGEYLDDNTIVVTGCQFNAIEVARNREGVNQTFYEALVSKVQSS